MRGSGKLNEALSNSETAITMVEGMRASVTSSALRTSYFASVRQNDLLIDVLMRLHHGLGQAGLDIKAYEASERARARSLLESLIEARTDIRQGIDTNLLERERSLQQMLHAKADRQAGLGGKNNKEGASLAKEIRALTAEYEELQGQIRSKSPRYAALTRHNHWA